MGSTSFSPVRWIKISLYRAFQRRLEQVRGNCLEKLVVVGEEILENTGTCVIVIIVNVKGFRMGSALAKLE